MEKVELYEALAKAQLEIKNPPKDKTASSRGSFSYKYTDLATMIDSSKSILAKHGLSIVSKTDFINDRFCCITRLIHTTGQYEQSVWPIQEGAPQAMGAAFSYARRYTRQGLTDVAGEDDLDGVHPPIEQDNKKPVTPIKQQSTPPSHVPSGPQQTMPVGEYWEKFRAKAIQKCFEVERLLAESKEPVPWELSIYKFGVNNKLWAQGMRDA